MAYVKRPNGFRAVRMRGKTEVVYCVEKTVEQRLCKPQNIVETFTADGAYITFTVQAFNANHAREHSTMPDAVRAMFQSKPSFAEWWDGRQK